MLFLSVSLIILIAPIMVFLLIRFTDMDSKVVAFSTLGVIIAIKGVFVFKALEKEFKDYQKLKKD